MFLQIKIGFVIDQNFTGKGIADFVNNLSVEILLEIKENCNEFSEITIGKSMIKNLLVCTN